MIKLSVQKYDEKSGLWKEIQLFQQMITIPPPLSTWEAIGRYLELVHPNILISPSEEELRVRAREYAEKDSAERIVRTRQEFAGSDEFGSWSEWGVPRTIWEKGKWVK